jgi:hypothetical protein
MLFNRAQHRFSSGGFGCSRMIDSLIIRCNGFMADGGLNFPKG